MNFYLIFICQKIWYISTNFWIFETFSLARYVRISDHILCRFCIFNIYFIFISLTHINECLHEAYKRTVNNDSTYDYMWWRFVSVGPICSTELCTAIQKELHKNSLVCFFFYSQTFFLQSFLLSVSFYRYSSSLFWKLRQPLLRYSQDIRIYT